MAKLRKPTVHNLSTPQSTAKKKYKTLRAAMKDPSTWTRYRPIIKRAWKKYKRPVREIATYLTTRYGDYTSQRQISEQMSKLGWRKYKKQKKQSNDSDTADDSSSADPIAYAPTDDGATFDSDRSSTASIIPDIRPTANNTSCLYSDHFMKVKGDAALVLGDYPSAFKIYENLASDAAEIHSFRSTSIDLLISSCLQCVSSTQERQQALSLLQRFHAHSSHKPELDLQMSLLKAHAATQSTAAREAALGEIVRDHLQGVSWSERPRPFSVADLGTWKVIVQVLWSLRDLDDESANTYDQDFLDFQPVKSWVTTFDQGDAARPSALFGCLEWASKRLLAAQSKPLRVPDPVLNIVDKGANHEWLNYFILFSTLLTDALSCREKLIWWPKSEPETSIPAIILLGIVCRMILDEQSESKQPIGSRDGDILLVEGSQLFKAVQKISIRAQDYIWTRFLCKISEETNADPVDDAMLAHVRQFLDTLPVAGSEGDGDAADETMTGSQQDAFPLEDAFSNYESALWADNGAQGYPGVPGHALPTDFDAWNSSDVHHGLVTEGSGLA